MSFSSRITGSRLRVRLLVPLTCLVVAVGCYSVTMRDVRDPGYNRVISRMFILINHGLLGEEFSVQLSSALRAEFTAMDVEVQIAVKDQLTLDDGKITRQIEEFGPHGVLGLTVVGGRMISPEEATSIIYDVSLYDPAAKKRVWRAQIENRSGTATYLIASRMKKMAQEISGRLRSEGLIGSPERRGHPL